MEASAASGAAPEPCREELRAEGQAWQKEVLSARRMVQAGGKALRIRHINGMEIRKKRPRGSREPPEPPSLSPWVNAGAGRENAGQLAQPRGALGQQA